jgi:hypothetical protein
VSNDGKEEQLESVTGEAPPYSKEVAEELQIPRKRFRSYGHETTIRRTEFLLHAIAFRFSSTFFDVGATYTVWIAFILKFYVF